MDTESEPQQGEPWKGHGQWAMAPLAMARNQHPMQPGECSSVFFITSPSGRNCPDLRAQQKCFVSHRLRIAGTPPAIWASDTCVSKAVIFQSRLPEWRSWLQATHAPARSTAHSVTHQNSLQLKVRFLRQVFDPKERPVTSHLFPRATPQSLAYSYTPSRNRFTLPKKNSVSPPVKPENKPQG